MAVDKLVRLLISSTFNDINFSMKALLLILLVFTAASSYGQNLKKKYLGTYSGTIPPYTMDAGGEVVEVKSAAVMFVIEEDKAVQTIDGISQTGRWQLMASKDDYYEIGFLPQNSSVIQKYYLFRKGKKMQRNGLYPQPDCELKKI